MKPERVEVSTPETPMGKDAVETSAGEVALAGREIPGSGLRPSERFVRQPFVRPNRYAGTKRSGRVQQPDFGLQRSDLPTIPRHGTQATNVSMYVELIEKYALSTNRYERGWALAVAGNMGLSGREIRDRLQCKRSIERLVELKDAYAKKQGLELGARVSSVQLQSSTSQRIVGCPASGTITLNLIGTRPQCDVSGH